MDPYLRAIVLRAMFLRERLQYAHLGKNSEGKKEFNAEPLERWRSAIGPKGADWLEKRLRWDGLDPAVTNLVLEETPLELDLLPDWAAILRKVSSTAKSFDPATVAELPVDQTSPLPFEDLHLPAVLVAREMLYARQSLRLNGMQFPLLGIISADAYHSLERNLLATLSAISGQTLEYELRRSQPYGLSLLILLGTTSELDKGDTHYQTFVRTHLESGLVTLFTSYPVLGKMIATAIEFWVEATGELLGRLVADFADIVDRFHLSGTPLHVSRFELNISDRHRRGRTVVWSSLSTVRSLCTNQKRSLSNQPSTRSWNGSTEEAYPRLCESPGSWIEAITGGQNTSNNGLVQTSTRPSASISGRACCCVCSTFFVRQIVITRT